QEIPDQQASTVTCCCSIGCKLQRAARDPVKGADPSIEDHEFWQLGCGNGKDAAYQDLLDMLRTLRRSVDGENGCRGGNDVQDADISFLVNNLRQATSGCEQRRSDRGKKKSVDKAPSTRRKMTRRERDGRTKCGHLRKSKVDENDATLQDVQAKIGMHGNE